MDKSATYIFADANLNSDTDKLLLNSSKYPDVDMRLAVVQILSRRAIKDKLPDWYANSALIYPSKLATEQCSSQTTANYKASLIKGDCVADLTGGLGIDTLAFAKRASKVDYYERYNDYCSAANHNFKTLGHNNITVHNCDFREELAHIKADTIYIDPARRGNNAQRVFSLHEYEPNVVELQDKLLNCSSRLIIKVSPMADISVICKEIKNIVEIHIVSVNNECKEVLIVAERNSIDSEIKIVTINFNKENRELFTYNLSEEQNIVIGEATAIEEYLYEPNKSILKSGAFKCVAMRYNSLPIGINSHLYTSSTHIEEFPGRGFRVIKCIDFTSKWLKQAKKEYPKANITTRNFPLSVAEIRKSSKIAEGGEIYLFATTIGQNRKVIVECRKV